MINLKKHFREALVIAALAGALGILYNSIVSRQLPWAREPKKEAVASDSALFGVAAPAGNPVVAPPVDPSLPGKDSAKTVNAINKDSLKKAAEKKEDEKFADAGTPGQAKLITYAQMQKVVKTPGIVIVDARSHETWSKKHIGKAINIFPYDEEEAVMNKVMDLPRDKTIVIYCDGGECDSSHKLADIMLNFGYKKVFIYAGGWEEWSKKEQR